MSRGRPRHPATRRRAMSRREHDVATRPHQMPPATPDWQLRTYRVDLQADQWDPDSTRTYVDVRASGEHDARNQVLLDHPGAGIRRVEVLR